jgi:hypothetical protein
METPHPPEVPRRARQNIVLVLSMAFLAVSALAHNLVRARAFQAEIREAQKDFAEAGGADAKAIDPDDCDPSSVYASALRSEARLRIDTATLCLRTTFVPLYSSLGIVAAALFCWYRGRPGACDPLEGRARGIDIPQLFACTLAVSVAVGPLLQSKRAASAIRAGAPQPTALALTEQQQTATVARANERVKVMAEFRAALNRLAADPSGKALDDLTALVSRPTFARLGGEYKQPLADRLKKVAESAKSDPVLLERLLKILDQLDAGANRTRLWATRFEWVDIKSAQANEIALGLIHQHELGKLGAMLKRGLDPDGGEAHGGRTLLYQAAALGNVQIATLLLDKGADVNKLSATSVQGERTSPLHAASAAGAAAVIDLLVSRKAEVNILDGDGATPLHVAVSRGAVESVQALLRHGADANRPNADKRSPLDQLYSVHYTGEPASRDAIRNLLTKHNARAGGRTPAKRGDGAQGALEADK